MKDLEQTAATRPRKRWFPRVRGGPSSLLYGVMALAFIAFLTSAYFMHRQLGGSADRGLTQIFTVLVGSFTLVILALAGALLLWMDSLAGQRAVRAQAQRMVDAMNHMEDGVVALDAASLVTGLNVRARAFAAVPLRPLMRLEELFPFLSREEVDTLLRQGASHEIKKAVSVDGAERTYRFRCHPASEIRLVFISDITREQEETVRREHEAGMQLIGRIAQGAAHDFNNILCAILGHAELLGLKQLDASGVAASARTIAMEAERGANLARQLVDLSQPVNELAPVANVREVLLNAASMLRRADPTRAWEIRTELEHRDWKTRMPGNQLEQLVIRFGLQAMDGYDAPGVVRIACRSPSVGGVFRGGPGCSAVLLIAAMPRAAESDLSTLEPDPRPPLSRDGGGLIQSVVLSVLERCGGALELLRQPNGYPAYRIRIPEAETGLVAAPESRPAIVPSDAFRYWSVLVVEPPGGSMMDAAKAETSLRWTLARANNIVAAFDRLEKGGDFKAILLDDRLLGEEPGEVVRRIRRLAPASACLVLATQAERPFSVLGGAVVAQKAATLDELLAALGAAQSLSAERSDPA